MFFCLVFALPLYACDYMCLVVNPITVGNFAFVFYCTPMGRTSDSMTVRLKDLSIDEMVGT